MQYLTDNSDVVMQRGAEISDCGTYRYRLWREWDRARPTLAFLMLNPSTADHLAVDHYPVHGASGGRKVRATQGSKHFTAVRDRSGRAADACRSARATQHRRRCGHGYDRARAYGDLRLGCAPGRCAGCRRRHAFGSVKCRSVQAVCPDCSQAMARWIIALARADVPG